MFNCGKTQIDTNKELILSLYETNAPRSRVHPSKAPHTASEYAKINEALYDWYVLAASKNVLPPQLVTFSLTLTYYCSLSVLYIYQILLLFFIIHSFI